MEAGQTVEAVRDRFAVEHDAGGGEGAHGIRDGWSTLTRDSSSEVAETMVLPELAASLNGRGCGPSCLIREKSLPSSVRRLVSARTGVAMARMKPHG